MNRRSFLTTLIGVFASRIVPKIPPKSFTWDKTRIDFVPHPAQIKFYGGARGGGKTDMYFMSQWNFIAVNPRQCARITNIEPPNGV